MSEKNQVSELLDKCNLNWKVNSENIQTESGIIIGGKQALVREDNGSVLSIVSNNYYPYQNDELMELLYRVSNKTGLEVHKGGSFKEGARTYIQLKSNDLKLGNDRIEGFLTGINSFDGSTSLAFGPSNITISCQNAFFAAFKEIGTKIRHTKNMSIRVDEVCARLENAVSEEKEIFSNIVKLSETRFDDTIKNSLIKSLFNIDKQVDLRDDDSVSSVTRNKMSRFYIDLNGELQDKGDNMWGLFSGVTKYTTHSITKNDNTEIKMFGKVGIKEQEIFADLVELV